MTDRGTSTALGYVLALAIAAALITGLLIASGNFVEDTRDQVVRQELRVIGQHVAANVEMADRMVEAGNDTEVVAVNQTFPARVTGSTYRVELVEQSDPVVRLNSTRPAVSVEIELDNQTAVGESFAEGGEITVTRESGKLVVRNA